MVSTQMIYAAAALVCAAVCAIHDLRDRRIPNRITGPSLCLGLLLHLLTGGWAQFAAAAAAGLIAGSIFFIFYAAGGMGAGDVKLITAVGCIVGIGSITQVLLATVIIGGAFAVAVALYRGQLRQTIANVGALVTHHQTEGLRAHPELNLSNDRTVRLPYALPILAGCLFTLCMLAIKGRA